MHMYREHHFRRHHQWDLDECGEAATTDEAISVAKVSFLRQSEVDDLSFV